MPADLIVYALVAAGLVFWLRSVLGTRHGEESERPNPFLSPDANNEEPQSPASEKEAPISAEAQIMALSDKTKSLGVDNKTAENGLIEIARTDKNFDVEFFLEGAQDAFVMIVESFAEGDKETLQNLLDEDVYKAFEGAIDAREKLGHTQMTDIHAIRRADILAAKMENKKILITVKFTADQASVTRDEDGEIIEGNPTRTSEMKDIWTFGRDIKSKDPSWLLMETRGDFEGDNDLIPDTH